MSRVTVNYMHFAKRGVLGLSVSPAIVDGQCCASCTYVFKPLANVVSVNIGAHGIYLCFPCAIDMSTEFELLLEAIEKADQEANNAKAR